MPGKSGNVNWISWILGALALVLLASPAHADRLAVVAFDGPRAQAFQRSVEKALSGRHTLVNDKRYARVAKRLGARDINDGNVERVAARLKVDGVLIGSVKKKGRSFQLTVTVRSGATGKVVGSARIESDKPKLAPARERALVEQLAGPLGQLTASSGSAPEPTGESADDPAPAAKQAEPSKPARTRRARARRARDRKTGRGASTDAAEERGGDPESSAVSSVATPEPRHGAFSLSTGAGITRRTLDFRVADETVDQPQEYAGRPTASAHIAGEIYPVALLSRGDSQAARVGLVGEYHRILLLESRLDTGAMEVALPTHYTAWRAGAVYRYTRGGLAVRASLGVTRMAFTIDTTDVPADVTYELPDVAYTFLDPDISVRVPIVGPVAITAGGAFLYAIDRGAIGDATSYGDGSALGYRADLLLEYRPFDSFALRAVGRFTHIGHSFDGTGTAANSRDGDPNTNDVPTAVDRYLDVYATAGYEF